MGVGYADFGLGNGDDGQYKQVGFTNEGQRVAGGWDLGQSPILDYDAFASGRQKYRQHYYAPYGDFERNIDPKIYDYMQDLYKDLARDRRDAYKDKQDRYTAYGNAASVGVGLLSSIKNLGMANQAANRNYKGAQHTYEENMHRLNRAHTLQMITYLQQNAKMQGADNDLHQKYYENLIKSQTGVNSALAAKNKLTHTLAAQRFDTFHRLKAADMSTLQGQIALSSASVEEAKRRQVTDKVNINYNKMLGQHQLEYNKALLGIQKQNSEIDYSIQASDQKYQYDRQLEAIHRANEEANRKEKSALFGAIGGVIGGVAGAVVGGPMGASMGMSVGGSLGGYAGTL